MPPHPFTVPTPREQNNAAYCRSLTMIFSRKNKFVIKRPLFVRLHRPPNPEGFTLQIATFTPHSHILNLKTFVFFFLANVTRQTRCLVNFKFVIRPLLSCLHVANGKVMKTAIAVYRFTIRLLAETKKN